MPRTSRLADGSAGHGSDTEADPRGPETELDMSDHEQQLSGNGRLDECARHARAWSASYQGLRKSKSKCEMNERPVIGSRLVNLDV